MLKGGGRCVPSNIASLVSFACFTLISSIVVPGGNADPGSVAVAIVALSNAMLFSICFTCAAAAIGVVSNWNWGFLVVSMVTNC